MPLLLPLEKDLKGAHTGGIPKLCVPGQGVDQFGVVGK